MKWLRPISLALLMVVCFVGCKATPVTTQDSVIIYEDAAQVLAMPSCRATIVEVQVRCYARFNVDGGRTFYIGSPDSPPEVAGFVGTLEEGKTYSLPEAFIQYRKKQNKPLQRDAAARRS